MSVEQGYIPISSLSDFVPKLKPGPVSHSMGFGRMAIEDIGAKSFQYLYDFGDGWTRTALRLNAPSP